MPKQQTEYVCNECGGRSRQYFGRCPACGSWNSLVEQTIATTPVTAATAKRRSLTRRTTAETKPRSALTLDQIEDYPQGRLSSSYPELDRVLGGGIVPGSLVLLGGDPGIGKSTLLLQVAQALASTHPILYICAEESGQQVKMRWQRLQVRPNSPPTLKQQASAAVHATTSADQELAALDSDVSATSHAWRSQLYLLPDIELNRILAELESLQPRLAIVDSIQAIYNPDLNSAPGSVSQVRECTASLMRVAKQLDIALLIVGHVTKDGAIAGPKVLEHLVDTVLYFEGDRFASHRLLRSVKNRFGATHELGIFEMCSQGLLEVANPSALFLGNQDQDAPGVATIVACEGTRPLVVELQALVSPTSYPSPRRSTTGIEFNRLVQILAVLEKRLGLPLSKYDVYLAAAGGLNVAEPAADLGVALAIAASFRDRVVQPATVLIGEVGLGGQIRPVSQLELRLKEAAKLGFKQALVPKGQAVATAGLELLEVSRVVEAISHILQPSPTQSVS
ncbi:MAG: DNA repair protein RadA [Cyanobacteria bacterium P01_H01_bin.121]